MHELKFIKKASSSPTLDITDAAGCFLTDRQKGLLFDFTSGWNVVNTGWNNEHIRLKLLDSLGRFPFKPSWCTCQEEEELSLQVTNLLSGCYFSVPSCTGSEAIENALKIARLYTGRTKIIGFTETYHGSTLGALLAGGVTPKYLQAAFDGTTMHIPLPKNCHSEEWEETIWRLQCECSSEPLPAAILVEPIFTNPGVLVPTRSFFLALSSLCQQYDIPLIVDEVGTGFGRTGKWFAFQNFNLDPDFIVVGKAMSSGFYPVSGVFAKNRYFESVGGPAFDSTFAWSPYGCVAASATIDFIERNNLLVCAEKCGGSVLEHLQNGLSGLKLVEGVRGLGLEIAIGLNWADLRSSGHTPKRMQQELINRGVYVEFSRYTNSMLIMPPLVVELETLILYTDVIINYLITLQKSRDLN